MSRRCELTGKAVQSGNLVSHSNRKTRTRFLPNLCNVTLISDTLGRAFKLRIAAASIRSDRSTSARPNSAASSNGSNSDPSAARRSGTSSRQSRSTSGAGRSIYRSYCSNRCS